MYNKVVMIGNLTRDIELRYLPSGAAVAKGAIATSYNYKTSTGEKKDEVCFLDFNIFNRSAEVANQYLRKGSKVLLEGRLVFEQWTAQDGTNRSKHSLRVDNMKMLDTKADAQNANTGYEGEYSQPQSEEPSGNQYNRPQSGQNSYAQGGIKTTTENSSYKIPEIDIDEDEIPF
jgi:single-strand DNA-binding protein